MSILEAASPAFVSHQKIYVPIERCPYTALAVAPLSGGCVVPPGTPTGNLLSGAVAMTV